LNSLTTNGTSYRNLEIMADYKNHTPPSKWPRIEKEIREWKPAQKNSPVKREVTVLTIIPFAALAIAVIIATLKDCQ